MDRKGYIEKIRSLLLSDDELDLRLALGFIEILKSDVNKEKFNASVKFSYNLKLDALRHKIITKIFELRLQKFDVEHQEMQKSLTKKKDACK